MSVGKGFTRPETLAPVSSIVQTAGSRYVEDGTWALVHLTNAVIFDGYGRRLRTIPLSMLHSKGEADHKVFRVGRADYSQAWHQPLPWMEGL